LKLTTDRHEASHGLSATAGLLVIHARMWALCSHVADRTEMSTKDFTRCNNVQKHTFHQQTNDVAKTVYD